METLKIIIESSAPQTLVIQRKSKEGISGKKKYEMRRTKLEKTKSKL